MSLDNFFVSAASSKKKKGGRRGVANASIAAKTTKTLWLKILNREKFDSMTRRMAAAEQRISDLEDVTTRNTPRMEDMEKTIKRTLERLDSLENQSRRQNIKIMGLKEGIEGRETAAFFEAWIPKVLGLQQTRIKIERAHRTGPPAGRSN
ncbi:hypothetical protein CRENBAI_007374 [Crenichthys baileyi]|uniref:Uncharacterized protein n=1 Tax=Crenichthys baileyi TaxID=28760 RepID=A0AAV9R8T2_9TELE